MSLRKVVVMSSGGQESTQLKYGVRVYRLESSRVMFQQTSGEHPGSGNNPYTLDQDENGKPIQRFVDFDDCEGIGRAVQDALNRNL